MICIIDIDGDSGEIVFSYDGPVPRVGETVHKTRPYRGGDKWLVVSVQYQVGGDKCRSVYAYARRQ
jgi:hypothetical protein